ncbi:TIGR04283 family arsenosugar biosynthesis glycosyltransferase [Parasedimentitalea huanghaiensis]|uniref:Glycosyltransferase n=1 Tax=Parasedimentitalea huanghaiensis TaxID=2682100 RepID=A0A6L6WDZ6_9RHOB|nr:TIGR04283 family arsenosugar biosynthesis glycosyltransferase [Zongyanglinia huanghaiensis]MVO16103.1 glycosyltransferase [Zongyanglinia huanghaiensis]
MRAEISIVIPTLNAEEELPACLETLMEGLAAGLIRELVVSDGGSKDATVQVAEAAGARVITGDASRGGQLQRGCIAARGNWLLVLHADTQLVAGWSSVVARHLDQGQGRPAYFGLRFRATGLMPVLVAGWANLRARVLGVPFGDQGLLIRRRDYEAAGGYPDQPLMEDVALVRRMNGLVALQSDALTSAKRYEQQGWLRRGTRNLWLQLRYLIGARPDTLARSYEQERGEEM